MKLSMLLDQISSHYIKICLQLFYVCSREFKLFSQVFEIGSYARKSYSREELPILSAEIVDVWNVSKVDGCDCHGHLNMEVGEILSKCE